MRLFSITLLLAFGLTSSQAFSADWLVSKDGGGFDTIGQAMAVCSPNDRILVSPGRYPAFQFTVAVDVIGLGDLPGDVRIDRIDYHVSIPVSDYDTLLSNVMVGNDDPHNDIAISGNELPQGTFHIDGVIVDGAVFLASWDSGFYLLVTDSHISTRPGEGFLGEAFYFGGPGSNLEVRNSEIAGSSADAVFPAQAGLRLESGTRARFSNAIVTAGHGSAAFQDGATALVRGLLPGGVELRLDGGSVLMGGDAYGTHAGGHGVDVSGTIRTGLVQSAGGEGTPPGTPYADARPQPLAIDLHLAQTPVMANAAGRTFLVPGDMFSFSMNTPPANTALLLSFDLSVPTGGLFLPVTMQSGLLLMDNHFEMVIPTGTPATANGLELYVQGLTNASGSLQVSETASIRVDLSP